MKKTLIALAALAAAGATLAQSSVTIYGRMDLGMSQQETRIGSTPAGTVQDQFSLAGAQNEWTGSRLGFRGTEDLGGGLRAGFVYEIGINPDRDAGTNAQTRLANLSLSGGFGTVVVGTFMNAFDTVREFSPGSGSIPGGRATVFEAGAVTERFDSRSQNAIAYVSPDFNGFRFSAGFVNNSDETLTLAGTPDAGGFDYTGMILGVAFNQGPLRAQFAYGNLDIGFHSGIDTDPATTGLQSAGSLGSPVNTDVTNWALGLSYDFGPAVVSFVYEDSSRDMVPVAAGRDALDGVDRNAWEIGARFPMGAFAPYVTFGQGERTVIATNGVRTYDINTWQIGTTYNLSARTWVYAAIGEAQRETSAGLNVREETGYSIGIVHTF